MDVYYIRLGGGEGFLAIPWWWFDVLLVWVGLMGAVIWLFGRVMARATFTAWGLSFGAVMGWLFVRLLSTETPAIPWIMIAGLLGGVGGFLAYRMLLAGAFGLLLAFAVSCVVVSMMTTTETSVWAAAAEGAADVRGTVHKSTERVTEASAAKEKLMHEEVRQFQIEPRVIKAIQNFFKAFGAWWSEIGLLMDGLMVILFLAAGAAGVLAGLMWPNLAVTVATGMGGALMMLVGMSRWIGSMLPESFLGWLVLLSIVGGVGVVIQMTMFKDDSPEEAT